MNCNCSPMQQAGCVHFRMGRCKELPVSEQPKLTVVALREGPTLKPEDIPAQLRALADRIEAGVYGEVHGMFALIPQEQAYPRLLGWGINDGAYDPIIQFHLAHEWFVKCAVGLPL